MTAARRRPTYTTSAIGPEAQTCRQYVVPNLQAAGWYVGPHSVSEQKTFTDGRILVRGSTVRRLAKKRVDYLLNYALDFPVAVVEAKDAYHLPSDGLQQAKDYAALLGLQFAYATNGRGIVEFDYTNGQETELSSFPAPATLWALLRAHQGLTDDTVAQRLLTPANATTGKPLRYYQRIAVNAAVEAILKGQDRLLLTLATGTGKTDVAFQICWKLSQARWNRVGTPRRPRILYLADRNVLVDDPKDKTFAPFGEARWKIENGRATRSREMYFSTYQAIAEDERRPGLYKIYPPDFFDLIVVDECHRGSARRNSTWQEILTYFHPACQLGMTATPLRTDNADSYAYFGNPLYVYSLRQGIEDGFLAPYRVHRIVTDYDAHGWRPNREELDRFGRAIPDDDYQTKDFERVVALRARTRAIARHLTDFLKRTDRFAKTIVFCVDQEHADEMRHQLNNANADLAQKYPNYVCRVTADEGVIGGGHLSQFQDLESTTPVILTTSQLLTTGVDAPTCKNIVLARVVGSMTEFKQIIGRGTRVREDYGKLFFSILDYTGSATRLFADPAFDGTPALATQEEIDAEGNVVPGTHATQEPEEPEPVEDGGPLVPVQPPVGLPHVIVAEPPRKFYFDGGQVEIVVHQVQELASDGTLLRTVKFTDYTADTVRTLTATADDLRQRWCDPSRRTEIVTALHQRGIDFGTLAAAANQPDADSFDLLCHLAFNAPLRTRRQRAEHVRRHKQDFFDHYAAPARAILNELLDKYAEHGITQLDLPAALKVPPVSDHGNPLEIAVLFGGAQPLQQAVTELQALLYAA